MPGWHVERIAKASITPDESAVVEANHIEVSESFVIPAVSAGSLQDPLIPLKALMAYAPSVEGVPELNTLHISQPADAFETLPIADHEIERQQAKRHVIAPGGLIAALLYLLALGVISFGLVTLFAGLLFGDALFVILGLLILVLALFMISSAKDPRAEWRRRAVERYRERLLNRVDRSEERAAKEDVLEANRAARKEELQLKEEQRRKKQEAEKQVRKAKRQAFFQDPFVKIALGFGAIIGLYLALF
jgi:ABC-type multidrug transport system fused ATPase/permease subunit